MPVTTKNWSPEGLWPPAEWSPIWFAPGGGPVRAQAAWGGPNLDVGSLRTSENGVWEIFMGAHGWTDFDPSNPSHMAHANRTNRYGPGQSFGEGLLNGHSKVLRDLMQERLGGRPSLMKLTDVGFNRGLASSLGLLGDVPGGGQQSPGAPQADLVERLDRIEDGIKEVLKAVAPKLLVLLVLGLAVAGCSAFRALMPANAMWAGTKVGTTSIAEMIDPRFGPIAALLQVAGQGDPLGVVLSLRLIGGTGGGLDINEVRQVICDGKWAKECTSIPNGARVRITGQPVGAGPFWTPAGITATDHDD